MRGEAAARVSHWSHPPCASAKGGGASAKNGTATMRSTVWKGSPEAGVRSKAGMSKGEAWSAGTGRRERTTRAAARAA